MPAIGIVTQTTESAVSEARCGRAREVPHPRKVLQPEAMPEVTGVGAEAKVVTTVDTHGATEEAATANATATGITTEAGAVAVAPAPAPPTTVVGEAAGTTVATTAETTTTTAIAAAMMIAGAKSLPLS